MMPNNDGTVIRLNVPELTKDRRKVPVLVLSVGRPIVVVAASRC